MIKYYMEKIPNEKIVQMYNILIENIFITYPEFLKERDKHDNNKNFLNWSNMINNTNDYHVLLYEKNNEIIGFLNFSIVDYDLWISEIQIKDNFKKKGIMKQLIKYFTSLEICNNYKKIIIHINENNKISKDVFSHIGFKSIGNTLYEININDLIEWSNK